jgi:uncharacterized protein (DUF433 family)
LFFQHLADTFSYMSDVPFQPSENIEVNPRVCGGQPVIKGTRIPVAIILEQLAENESWSPVLAAYPELTRADVKAALDFARHSVLHTEFSSLRAA